MVKRKLAANKENENNENESPPKIMKNTRASTAAAAAAAASNQLGDISNTTTSSRSSAAAAAAAIKKAQEEDDNRIPNNHEIEVNFKSLNDCLKNLSKCGDYSVDGEAVELPKMVGLEVKNFGPVSLPLRDPQASELIKVCQKAPYGFNQQTLMDQNVRDSYQLDPSLVEITNPEWNVKLNELVARAAKGLGCHSKVEAKLYKMLVYKEGGHFLKHRDTEKEKQMFATLIIQLPSAHKGGELVIYENNGRSKKVIDFGQKEGKSEFSIYFAAHYADLEHELLEVKSGYRLALVYSLCWVKGNGNCITNETISNNLASIFDILNRKQYHLGIILDHQYTSQSFRKNGARALKGIDNEWFNLLENVNSRLPAHRQLSFYICHASLIINSYDTNMPDSDCDESDYEWEESDREMELKWYDVKGQPVFNNCNIELDFFTKVFNPSHKTSQEVDLKDEEAWGKHVNVDIDGYTGNEGASKTTEYSRYLLVIWPKRFEFDTLIDLDINLAIDLLHKSLVDAEHKPSDVERADIEKNFNQLLSKICASEQHLNQEETIKSLRLTQIFNKREYFDHFIDAETPILTKLIADELARTVAHFGFDAHMKKKLASVIKPEINCVSKNCDFIESLVKENLHKAAEQYFTECILHFVNVPNTLDLMVKMLDKNDHVKLAKCLKLMKATDALECYKQATLKTALSKDSISDLISGYLKERETFADCAPIREMFEERLKGLQVKVKDLPPFSWKMTTAKMSGHPNVEMFLRSEQETMVYTAPFRYVKELNSFVSKYKGCFKLNPAGYGNYSVEMEGTPSKSVLIKKTRDWYNTTHGVLAEFAKECEKIKSFLDFNNNQQIS